MTPATQNAETDIQGEGPGNQEETRERGMRELERDEGTREGGNWKETREQGRDEGRGNGVGGGGGGWKSTAACDGGQVI